MRGSMSIKDLIKVRITARFNKVIEEKSLEEVIEFFEKNKNSINLGQSYLHAVKCGRTDVVKWLLSFYKGYKYISYEEYPVYDLIISCKEDDKYLDMLRILLSINALRMIDTVAYLNIAYCNNKKVYDFFKENGAIFDKFILYEMSMAARKRGFTEMADFFLEERKVAPNDSFARRVATSGLNFDKKLDDYSFNF